MAFGILFTVVISLIWVVLYKSRFGETKGSVKNLKVTIPESLDYTEVFDDIFAQYTNSCELIRVRTTNLGSMIELSYEIELKDIRKEKQFIDDIRCRNGNLTIICSRAATVTEEL